MIPCQRHLFDIPDDVAYFNCAYTSPLLKSARSAAQTALETKAHPWTLATGDFFAAIRIAPHVYTSDHDMDRLLVVLADVSRS